jgi:elongator complex protein 1
MYRETLKTKDLVNKSTLSQDQVANKVNRISDAFLAVLEQPQYKNEHLQNIITSHVSKVPPALEAGLEMIGRLQTSQDPLTDKAAEHICFLADVNQLYDTALGLYNLDLALLIAQQSQKDPREYLPHLQSLQDLPHVRRRFQIDDQLGRRAKALTHLKELQAFDEAQDYIQQHVLYTNALVMYQYDAAQLKKTMRLYADYLSSTNKHKEAALAYEYLSDHASAWPSYRSANLWREALSSATLAGVSDEELTDLASSLAEGLTESKDYHSAATITVDYLSDVSAAAKLMCRGHHFAEATRLVVLRRDPSLIESVIDPSLIERSADMTEFLADMRSQLLAQVPRLQELRTKKADDPMAFYDGMDGIDNNIPDNISLAPTDTTSGGTFMTRYTKQTGTVNTTATRKTSKNKRREERKRAKGKKGTIYEEEYLNNSIERLIERINSMQDEIQRLVEGLVRRGMRERADAVSRAHQDVVEKCRDAVREMYPVDPEAAKKVEGGMEDGVQGIDGVVKPTGGDATLWESLQEVERKRIAPVVKGFERLSFL